MSWSWTLRGRTDGNAEKTRCVHYVSFDGSIYVNFPFGDGAQDFERKSALFSLASSEVLIINLWEHQVGLYQGANMGLLKTVFEVNLGLFGKKTADGYAMTCFT